MFSEKEKAEIVKVCEKRIKDYAKFNKNKHSSEIIEKQNIIAYIDNPQLLTGAEFLELYCLLSIYSNPNEVFLNEQGVFNHSVLLNAFTKIKNSERWQKRANKFEQDQIQRDDSCREIKGNAKENIKRGKKKRGS